MAYYEKKIEAQKFIKEILNTLHKEGIDSSSLYLIIVEKFGFGSSFCDKYINLLISNDLASIKKGKIRGVEVVKN